MIFLYKLTAWVPPVEPGSCSHLELRLRNGNASVKPSFKKRFKLESESGYWGEWIFSVKAVKQTMKKHGFDGFSAHGGTVELAMVSINGVEGPLATAPLYDHLFTITEPLVEYNEPVSVKAIKKKKPVVDAHWNATFNTISIVGPGKEIQTPGP